MRRVFIASGIIAGLLLSSQAFAQAKAKAQNVPEIAYDSVPNFLKFPPNIYLGEGIGVATNSKGHVFVYTRSGDTRLVEFDQNGGFVREIGQGLYGFEFAHAVRVDRDDNVWAVDEGTNMRWRWWETWCSRRRGSGPSTTSDHWCREDLVSSACPVPKTCFPTPGTLRHSTLAAAQLGSSRTSPQPSVC